jgi:hypothetical protein
MSDVGQPGEAQQPEPTKYQIQDFIFAREMAEVYLLLDNVSMSANKNLPAKTANSPDLIEEICNIGWPPSGDAKDRAHQAAVLLRARDTLNNLAEPANGATIAFTLLVAGEAGLKGLFTKAKDEEPPWTPENGWGDKPPSRRSLALLAFPNLRKEAILFRYLFPIIILLLALTFVGTSLLSWNIADGNAVLAEWTRVKADITQQATPASTTTSTTTGATPTLTPLSAAAPVFHPHPHHHAAAPDAAPGAKPDTKPSVTDAQKKSDGSAEAPEDSNRFRRIQNERNLAFAGANLNHWLGFWQDLLHAPTSVSPNDCDDVCAARVSADVNEKWATALLNVLGGAVLPILYGVLGAGSAVVRSLSMRMRESLLAPRYMILAFVQVALGAVIGGCIGLFVTPSGAPSSAQPGLLGAAPLSGSALCFIAGFGVDGVFETLEALVRRIFDLPDPKKPQPPPAAPRTS